MKSRMLLLMGQKAALEGRRITLNTVVADTKLTKHTVYGLNEGSLTNIPARAIIELCRYFACDVGDLLTIVEVPDPTTE